MLPSGKERNSSQITQAVHYMKTVPKDTLLNNPVIGRNTTGKIVRLAGIVALGFATATYKNQSDSISSLQGTIDAMNPKRLEVSDPTRTPFPTSTIESTAAVAQAPTEVPSVLPTETLTPTYTVTSEDGKYIVSSYHVSFEQTPFAINDNGIARINMDAYKAYMKAALAKKGEDSNGERFDFDANMLGSEAGEGDLTLSHQLNFWISEMKGLGWTPDDVNFIFSDLDSFRNALKTGQDVMSKRDGKARFALRVKAKDFENAIGLASIARYLDGAGKLDGKVDEMKQYLSQSGASKEVMNLISTLISSSGYSQLPGGDPTETLDSPATLLDKNVNFVSNNGQVCLAIMGNAETRGDQRETSIITTYEQGLESTSAGNDETLNNLDSEDEIMVYVTYDMRADVTANGAYSPTDKGIMRVDILAFPNVVDPLSKIDPKTYVFVDKAGQLWMKSPGSRWIPCGKVQQVQPKIPTEPQAGQPQPPEQPTQPPRKPTQPPQWPTPAPTNVVNPPTATQGPKPVIEPTATDIP